MKKLLKAIKFLLVGLVLLVLVVPIPTGTPFGLFFLGHYLLTDIPKQIDTLGRTDEVGQVLCAALESPSIQGSAQIAIPQARRGNDQSWGFIFGNDQWFAFMRNAARTMPRIRCGYETGIRFNPDDLSPDPYRLAVAPFVKLHVSSKYGGTSCVIDIRRSLYTRPKNQLAYWPRLCWHGAKTDAWIETKLA